jgi:hypothetical protein
MSDEVLGSRIPSRLTRRLSLSVHPMLRNISLEKMWIRILNYMMSHHQRVSAGVLRGMGSVHSDGVSESFSPMDSESHLL